MSPRFLTDAAGQGWILDEAPPAPAQASLLEEEESGPLWMWGPIPRWMCAASLYTHATHYGLGAWTHPEPRRVSEEQLLDELVDATPWRTTTAIGDSDP